jgi:Rrf2 family protein
LISHIGAGKGMGSTAGNDCMTIRKVLSPFGRGEENRKSARDLSFANQEITGLCRGAIAGILDCFSPISFGKDRNTRRGNRGSVIVNTCLCDSLGYSAVAMPDSRDGKMEKCNSSMQLTRAADYGVRVMVHLATLDSGERAMLSSLAAATDAPESFLSKVLQSLARAELISSRRGNSGGFAILPRGRAASMYQVIEAIDGPICLNRCLVAGDNCDRKAWCPAHPVWARAQHSMVSVLKQATVAQLASNEGAPRSSPSYAFPLLPNQEH